VEGESGDPQKEIKGKNIKWKKNTLGEMGGGGVRGSGVKGSRKCKKGTYKSEIQFRKRNQRGKRKAGPKGGDHKQTKEEEKRKHTKT